MLLKRLRLTLEMIRFEHSVFALPFALTGALLAFRESGGFFTDGWRTLAWIVVRGRLAVPERLHVAENVGQRGVQLPAESVVEGHVGLDAPTVLPEEVVGVVAYVLGLRRTL